MFSRQAIMKEQYKNLKVSRFGRQWLVHEPRLAMVHSMHKSSDISGVEFQKS